MDILIITPGHPGPDKQSLPPALTAPYLASFAAPFSRRIRIIDLAVQPFNGSSIIPDVALLSTTMAQSDQIFDIAQRLKARGAKIIMGGPHVTLCHELDPRIKAIADSIVLGEGERALPQALEDLQKGYLKPLYHMPLDSLEGIPFSRLDLLDSKKYYSSTAIIGTRGCTHNCTYCSIRDIYGTKYLKRPVEEVIEEIRFQTARPNIGWLDRKLIQFWDDNPACDLDWFHTLLEKMIPFKKWWLSQMCLNVADNVETVKLMKRSGCQGVFVGIESVSGETLVAQNKASINQVSQYVNQAKTFLKNGINVIGAVMYGFDQDTQESLFARTPAILEQMGLTLLQGHIVTPYPHSDYYRILQKEGRLLTDDAKYYNGYTIVHRPKKIHPAELQQGFIETRKKFYSFPSILKRMLKHKWHKMPQFLIWNAMFYKPNYQSVRDVDVDDWLRKLSE